LRASSFVDFAGDRNFVFFSIDLENDGLEHGIGHRAAGELRFDGNPSSLNRLSIVLCRRLPPSRFFSHGANQQTTRHDPNQCECTRHDFSFESGTLLDKEQCAGGPEITPRKMLV
jgi:hypothetical protein